MSSRITQNLNIAIKPVMETTNLKKNLSNVAKRFGFQTHPDEGISEVSWKNIHNYTLVDVTHRVT